jgi:hypothetical protein
VTADLLSYYKYKEVAFAMCVSSSQVEGRLKDAALNKALGQPIATRKVPTMMERLYDELLLVMEQAKGY